MNLCHIAATTYAEFYLLDGERRATLPEQLVAATLGAHILKALARRHSHVLRRRRRRRRRRCRC